MFNGATMRDLEDYLDKEADRHLSLWQVTRQNAMLYPIWSKMRWYWWGRARKHRRNYIEAVKAVRRGY